MRFVDKPKVAWLTINRSCDMRCKWCYAQGTNYNVSDDMSLEMVKKAISIIKSFGINKVVLIGGEPTRHKQFKEILKICHENAIQPSIITNGLSLSNSKYLEDLIELGLKNINLSIKGQTKEDYLNFVGIDCFDSIVRSIDNILNRKLNLTVSYVLTNENVCGLFDLFSRLNRMGVKNFYISFCNPYFDGQNISNYGIEIFELIDNFIVQCNKLFNAKIRFNFHMTLPLCLWPKPFIDKLVQNKSVSTSCQLHNRSGIIFDTNLNVIPCNSLYNYPYLIYGKDYNDYTSLKEVLYSNEINKSFEKLLSAPSDQCVSCKDFIYCAGGCLLQWFTYDFNKLLEIKEEYYARKTCGTT